MSPDLAHWAITTILGSLLAVVAWIFTTTRTDFSSKIAALETQNASQERELATLRANVNSHDSSFDRLVRSIEKMDDKIDALMQYLGRGRTPSPFPSVKDPEKR